MKYLPLIWANLTSRKLRTAFTFCCVVFAFVLFGVLSAIENAFSAGVAEDGPSRLRMIHKVSVVQSLPVRYYDRITAVEGVARATYVLWFGGVYQNPANFFPQLAVNETFLDVYPEYQLVPADRARWEATRTGAVVGRSLADRFGWRVGDRIPLRSTIYRQEDGGDVWEFTLEGIFDGADAGVDESQMFFHHDYLEETSPFADGEVRWFVIVPARGVDSTDLANRLDRQFANSSAATKTSTERAFLQSFANQVGDTALIINFVVGVTFFVILLVVANAVAHAVRERIPELAVLKAMGYADGTLSALVVGECVVLCVTAGMFGLLLAGAAVGLGVPTQGMTGVFRLTVHDVVEGLGFMTALALASAVVPVLSVLRIRLAAALGRG